MSDRRVILAVDEATAELTDDDRVLAEAIGRLGVDVRPMVWGSGLNVETATVVIRSVWDYVERVDEFTSWLDELDAAGVQVANPTAMLRWNLHKGYLVELARRGVAVVPTELLRAGSGRCVGEVMAERGWAQAVVKPAVSASARNTFRVASVSASAAVDVRRVVESEDVLVQPFVSGIETDGELSIVVIGGVVTHVVEKRSAAGEWRVQSDFGGTVARIGVSGEHVETAAAVLAALDKTPAYARVDVVAIDGVLHLMELELIEPDLFFGLAPEAAEELADLVGR